MLTIEDVKPGKKVRTVYRSYGKPIVSENEYKILETCQFTNKIKARNCWGDKVLLHPKTECVIEE